MKYVCIRTYPRVWPSGWKANRPPPVKGEIFTKIGSYKRWEAWYFCFAELDVRVRSGAELASIHSISGRSLTFPT
jgi:hypothetical protein